MDRTSWKPKVFKATEAVDYKAEEEGTSDGAKKGWLTRQRGGSAEEPKKDFTPIDWAGQVGATKSEADQDKASDLMDKYYELINEPMEDLPTDGSAMEERRSIHAKGVADFKAYLESSGSATVNQDVTDILEDENYHSLNKMLTKEEPETQSSRDKEFYDQSTQNTLDTLNQSKVNGFPFFSYVGQPKQVISDGKGGIILYGMKRNPNSIRRVDVKYDEGRDTYTVSFMSNRNKPKGEYNDVYFDQLSGLIAGNKGLGVESKANEDDHKKSWDELDSIAKKGFSDIGYDQKSWDSEPEDIRKEMETVVKGNMSKENWKDMANKFYNEELNKGKKSIGEAMYGYGSATGRMSPVEAWNQGADVYGDMGYDQSLRNPIFDEFRGLQWNELPTDIQEAWKSELGYMTKGEGLADNIEKQLNRFGINLDRDPEQVEEAHEAYFVEWGYDLDYDFAEIDDIDEAKQKAEAEGGNVYLNDQLVYSVIPSIKKDPTNDKSNFIMGNHVMDVESLARDNGGEGYVNIDDDGFYNPIGISDVPSIIGGIAKDYGKKLIKPFQEDKSGDWEIQVKDDNGEWKTYEYGGHYFGKDGADHDAKNLSKVNRVVRKGSGYESKASEGIYEEYVNKFGDNQSLGGGFGDALRANDLELAFSRADTDNYNKLKELGYAWTGNESKASEGFNQGLYGYVDAKCKTCGIEFDSIPDMDDHYAMNSDHISNLDDLDSDIPNSD